MRTATSVASPGRVVAFGPFTFDRSSRLLSRNGSEVPLPPRVLGVLALLLDRAGDVVAKQELMAAVWRDAFVTETSLSEAISVLRQTLGDDPQRPTYIQTLHRRGYRFIAEMRDPEPVVAVGAPAPAPLPAAAPAAADASPSLSLIAAWAIAALAVLAAAVAIWQYLKLAEPPARHPSRFALTLPGELTVSRSGGAVAVSSDGSLVALSACRGVECGIYLRPMSQLEPILVAGTVGGMSPFFSPDGESLGYYARGRLHTVALGGGSPVEVADAPEPLGATWLPDGHIVFARSLDEGLFIVKETGGRAQPLTTPRRGERGHRWPAAVRGSATVVFTVDGARYYAAAVSTRTRRWSRLLDDVIAARVALPGYLVAQRGAELIAGAVDPTGHSMTGLPVPVAALDAAAASPQFALGAAGTLVMAAPGASVVHVVLDWSSDLRRLVPSPRPAIRR